MPELQVFLAETDGAWVELTAGDGQVMRISAPDLQEAARRRRRLPADVAVVLDLAMSVADDPRTALAAISDHDGDSGCATPERSTGLPAWSSTCTSPGWPTGSP